MEKRTLAFEIGTEEIPAFDLAGAVKQLSTMVPSLLDDAAIPHGAVKIFSSPRRLIVIAEEIPEATEEKNEVFKGPSAKIAFDAEGNPTKAAQGFARGKGVDPSSLVVEDGYVYARTHTPSVNVASLLSSVLNKIIHGLSWPRSQRWGVQSEYFTRPVRWIVALFGNEVIDFTFAGLVAGRTTYGHRFLAPGPFEVADADSLVDVVRSASVIPSEAEREQVIREGVAKAEAETGFTAVLHPKTLVEVINLAEYPTVLVGTFDEEFLKVPEEIIVDAMLVHQRYFPLYDKDGKLTNRFIVVSNGDPACAETIVDGNERVVRARLYDAKFFYDEDLKQPLESYVDHLGEVVFQEKLGTMLDKTNRIQRLADHLAEDAGLAGQDLNDRNVDPTGPAPDLGMSVERFYNPLVRRLAKLPKPVICAVNGVAAGAGATLALGCDIVIAARSAKFVMAFSKLGLIPDCGGTWLLPRVAGRARAMGLALLGNQLSAEQAHEWGMIWQVVDDETLADTAQQLARHLATQPTFGLGLIKQAINSAETNTLDTQLDLERDYQRLAGRSADYREGVSAFLAKRSPQFTGK